MLEFMLVFAETYGIPQDVMWIIGLLVVAAFLTAFSVFSYFCADLGMALYKLIEKRISAFRSKRQSNNPPDDG